MSIPARRHRASGLPELSEWFEAFPPLLGWRPWPEAQVMRLEEYVEDGRYVVRAELPGVDPAKDVEITVQDGILTIAAERGEQTKAKNRSEFRYGSFARGVRLPEGVREDTIAASYTDGILTVSAEVGEVKQAARRIPVGRADEAADNA